MGPWHGELVWVRGAGRRLLSGVVSLRGVARVLLSFAFVASCRRVVSFLCDEQIVCVEQCGWPLVGSSSVVVPQVGFEGCEALVIGVEDERRRELALPNVSLGSLVVASSNAWIGVLLQWRKGPSVVVIQCLY